MLHGLGLCKVADGGAATQKPSIDLRRLTLRMITTKRFRRSSPVHACTAPLQTRCPVAAPWDAW